MEPQTQTLPFQERRKSGPRHESPLWTVFLLVVTLSMAAGFAAFAGHLVPVKYLYKPGDNIGYNLGLAGGLMMLIMLLYSLRKRFKFMKDRGILPTWFRWHMVLGILGPALVVFHSTYTLRSINAGVAFTCMMLVSGSGIFGRFFYTKIHNGLYGRQMTLKGLQDEMARTGGFNRSIMLFAPEIGSRLDQFHIDAGRLKDSIWGFLKVGIQAHLLEKSLVAELQKTMYAQAKSKNLDSGAARAELDKLCAEYTRHVVSSIKAAKDAAQFHTYERLFSLWHIFHIPLVYMLLFSGIYHVIAVHMY